MSGHQGRLGLGDLGGPGPADLHVDAPSGLFLVIAFGVAVPVLLAGASPTAWTRPRLPAAIALPLDAVEVILTPTVCSCFCSAGRRSRSPSTCRAATTAGRPGQARAAVVTTGFGKVSGAALLTGGLILAGHSHTFRI